jgi:hypothetical protein
MRPRSLIFNRLDDSSNVNRLIPADKFPPRPVSAQPVAAICGVHAMRQMSNVQPWEVERIDGASNSWSAVTGLSGFRWNDVKVTLLFPGFKRAVSSPVISALDYPDELVHISLHNAPSRHMRRQEEANVVRLPTHITALSAPNAWSFYRPDDRRFVCTVTGTNEGKQPEQAFKTPG